MENKERFIELLAPAGSFDSMGAAFKAGADAVYMGGPRYGARAFADNPDEAGLSRAIDYAHLRGKRLYLTVNTLLKNHEMGSALYEYLRPLYEQGLDAVIVQDLGVFSFIREAFPGLPIHGSTQMTVAGPEGAALLKEQGLARLVLPRELSLEEIRTVYERTGLDLEVFIHGALCYAYSGQCLMSSLIGGRSGNRGRCAQPCRLPYEGGSWLNMRDLCALHLLPALKEAGACSLKIEGRMKSPLYTAGVVSIYRKYLNLLEAGDPWQVNPADEKLLFALFNRGDFTSGYLKPDKTIMINPEGKQNRILLSDGEEQDITERFLGRDPLMIEGVVRLVPGEPLKLSLKRGDLELTVEGEPVQPAESRPLTEEQVLKQIGKTGDSGFDFEKLAVETDGDSFVPVSALNALRRSGLTEVEKTLLKDFKRPEAHSEPFLKNLPTVEDKKPVLRVLVDTEVQLEETLKTPQVDAVYLPADYVGPEDLKEAVDRVHAVGKRAFYTLPFVFRGKARQVFESPETLQKIRESGLEGVLLRSLDELAFWQDWNLPGERIADAGLYAWNQWAERLLANLGADRLTIPLELHEKDIGPSPYPREQVVYGRLPLMTGAQCVQKNREDCLKAQGRPALTEPFFTELKDRTGSIFPHESRCRYCLSVLYNSVPLYLGDMARGDADWRIQFSTEGPRKTRQILDLFAEAIRAGRRPEGLPSGSFTRGNYKRGVQ